MKENLGIRKAIKDKIYNMPFGKSTLKNILNQNNDFLSDRLNIEGFLADIYIYLDSLEEQLKKGK